MEESAINEMKNFLSFNRYNDINDICSPLYGFGIKGFFYIKLYPDGTFVDLTTNLSLAEFYLRKFYCCEYSLCDMNDNYLPIGINLWELNKTNKIWADCREGFNVGNGFSMSLPSDTGFNEIFFFYSDAANYKINELYLNHLDIFKNFSFYFKEKAEQLIKKAEKYKITMPDYYQEIYLPQNNSESNINKIKDYYSLLNIKKFYFSDKEYLTYREAECLSWYTQGMTIKETAQVLGLSCKTIESHLDNIKIKLKCFNKAALTNVALTLGLVKFFQNKLR